MKRLLIIIVLFFTYLLFSQEDFIFEQFDAPFVFDLELHAYGRKVLLTWRNPEKFQNNLLIYRSGSYIADLRHADKIAELTHQETRFVDEVVPGSYYYAVLIEDQAEKGKVYMLFIPYRNTSVKPVTLRAVSEIQLTSLKAYSDQNVHLQWEVLSANNTDTDGMVYFFRSLVPVINEDIFDNAIFAFKTPLKNKTAVDIVGAGVSYYYYAWIEGGTPVFLPDVTYTTKAFSVQNMRRFLQVDENPEFTPLPLLVFQEDPLSGKKLKREELERIQEREGKLLNFRKELHSNWISVQENIFQEYQTEASKMLHMQFLKDEEIYSPPFYQEKYQKIQECLKRKEWNEAKTELEQLLSSGLPHPLYERVNYYLGMLSYCASDFYNSYLYFNSAGNEYSDEVQPYLQSISVKIYENLK